jgi:hypothetical protein
MLLLGKLYSEDEDENGNHTNYTKALEIFKKAADLGLPQAASEIGYIFKEGLGVKADFYEAKKWYLKGAQNNNVFGETGMGELFMWKFELTVENIDSANYWIEKAENNRNIGSFRKDFIENPIRTPFIPSTILMSRKLISHVGYWDTTFKSPSEDFDYFRRCAKHTDFEVVKEQLVFHRDHPGSLTARSLEKYFLDNRLAIIKLFSDEYPEMSYWEMKKCWSKLNFSYFKAFAKSGNYLKSSYCLLSCILPILYSPR